MAILVGIGLLLWRFFGNPKKKDAIMTAGVITIIGGFLFAPAAFVEIQTLLGRVTTATVAGATQTEQPEPTGLECKRQTDGTNTLNVLYRNVENSSLGYIPASVSAYDNGQLQDSGTTTAGVTASYLALNVPPCRTGKIYAMASTGHASSAMDYNSYELTDNFEVRGAAANVINLLARDSSFTSSSNGTAGYDGTGAGFAVSGVTSTDGTTYYKNTTLASGGNINFYLDISVNGTSTAFGAIINGQPASDGVIISYDTVDAAKFGVNSLSLVSDTSGVTLNKVTCPSDISANRNAEVCWKMRSLKASDGEIRLRGTLKADLGDPAADSSDSPKLCLDDNEYFEDTDGSVEYAAYDTGGTNKGLGATCIIFQTN